MVPEVPVIELVSLSFAVMVLFPVVTKVAWKVPVPLISVESAGSFAFESVLVKCTVPV